jgi:PAS domain S-box-containing protein
MSGKDDTTVSTYRQSLFNDSPLGIYLVDSAFRIKAVNPMALPAFGDIPNLIGSRFDEVVRLIWNRDFAEEVIQTFRETLEYGTFHRMSVNHQERRDSDVVEHFKWQISRILLPNDDYGVICYFQDISLSVHTQQAVEESKAELLKLNRQIEQQAVIYNTTLSTITDYVYRLNRDGKFIYANQALLDLWGIKELPESGIWMSELDYPPEVEAKVLEGVNRVFESRKTVKDQTAYTSPTGAIEFHEFIFNPVFAENGEVDFIIGSSRDISEHKKLETELKTADRRKDEFLATLAHELRNPLAPIRTGLEVIQQYSEQIPPPVKTSIEVIERQNKLLIRLVDDLLDISRITQGKIKLQKAAIDINAAIEMAIETCQDVLEDNGHTLSVTPSDERLVIYADIVRLSQIILNVLSNAAKYTPPGGTISLTTKREGDEAVIIVRDTGIGIPADMLPRVFHLFHQIESVDDQTRSGLGIGLSVAKDLTEMHNGTISAFSEGVGKGTEFTIRFPIADVPATADIGEEGVTQSPPQPVNRGPKARILLVDDNIDAAEMLKLLLRGHGYEVHTAYDAESALPLVERLCPDICLCDIGLPGMNGYELGARLRAMLPDVTLIAISGWGQEEDRRQSKQAGFDHHLVKPVAFDSLMALLVMPRA